MAFPLSVRVLNEVYYHIVFHCTLDGVFAFLAGLHGKVNLIFCRNFLTERAAALYSTISTAAASVLLLSGGQGWRLHFKWKPSWNSNGEYRQI